MNWEWLVIFLVVSEQELRRTVAAAVAEGVDEDFSLSVGFLGGGKRALERGNILFHFPLLNRVWRRDRPYGRLDEKYWSSRRKLLVDGNVFRDRLSGGPEPHAQHDQFILLRRIGRVEHAFGI